MNKYVYLLTDGNKVTPMSTNWKSVPERHLAIMGYLTLCERPKWSGVYSYTGTEFETLPMGEALLKISQAPGIACFAAQETNDLATSRYYIVLETN